ncbi:MAG: hypothetical protein ACOC95_00960 [Planctomycetota bacterium]
MIKTVPIVLVGLGLLYLPGCLGDNACDELAGSLAAREGELDAARRNLAALRETVDAQAQQIQTLREIGASRLDRLFHVRRIRLGRYTGGIDTDETPGHDAVKVYLEPIDQHGSVIKAAGDVTIELFDLPAGGVRLGTFTFGGETLADQWRSGPLNDHFSFVCPFGSTRPSGSEVTVRVTFTEYLTGKTFTTQTAAPVR